MYAHERSLVKRLENEPFALIGVNSDKDREELKDVLENENISWRSFWNGGSTQGPISTRWGVSGWPTIYVLDAEGVIRFKNVRGEAMDKAVDELLAEMKAKQESGGDEPEPEADPAEELDAILAEYEAKTEALWDAIDAAGEDKVAQRAAYELAPNPADYAPRVLEIGRAHPDTEAGFRALAWYMENGRGSDTGVTAEVLTAFATHHLEREELVDVVAGLGYNPSPESEDFARKLLSKSPHRKVRGRAAFALAQIASTHTDLADAIARDDEEFVSRYARYYGDGMIERVRERGLEAVQAERDRMYELVVADYADVKSLRGTLGEAAERNLFEIRHLQIGMVAPDIDGTDLDEVAFKLSDYRGKVVVLDFWGDW